MTDDLETQLRDMLKSEQEKCWELAAKLATTTSVLATIRDAKKSWSELADSTLRKVTPENSTP